MKKAYEEHFVLDLFKTEKGELQSRVSTQAI